MNLVGTVLALGLALSASTARLPGVLADLYTPPFGKLTQFWAQQAAGVPEGHAFIRELEQQHFSFATSQLGVLDSGFNLASILAGVKLTPQLQRTLSEHAAEADDRNVFAKTFPNSLRDFLLPRYASLTVKYRNQQHGSAVAYLLASNTTASISLKGEIALLLPFPRQVEKQKLHELIATLPLPPIINYSMSFDDDDRWSLAIAVATASIAEKTILVVSAGNNAPELIEAGKRMLAQHLIIVGSADPTGHVSAFSQTGCAETIRACSDKYIQSINPKSGEFFDFGGTSAAAPLVSGALADTLSILPDLSHEQAVLLLQNTALTNLYGDDVGLLNYYKLLRVAYRLVERGWSATGNTDALHDARLYDFRAEAQQLVREAIVSTSPATAFTKLRRAFFLDHDNSDTRAMLAAVYRQHDYKAEAFFYGNPNSAARDAFIAKKDREQKATR